MNDQFKIVFLYTKEEMLQTPITTCEIFNKNKVQIAKSEIKLYFKDHPNRLVARKIAFQNTVSKLNDRKLRTILWQQFRSTHKQADLEFKYKVQKEVRRILNSEEQQEKAEMVPVAEDKKLQIA